MGSFSLVHWAILIIVVMLLFGRGRISDLMGDFAKGITSFKKGLADAEAPPADAPLPVPIAAPSITSPIAAPSSTSPIAAPISTSPIAAPMSTSQPQFTNGTDVPATPVVPAKDEVRR